MDQRSIRKDCSTQIGDWNEEEKSTSVVLNRGSAAHKGAVRQCQGCRLLSLSLTFRPILASRGVSPKSEIVDQGCREAKKVEKHWSTL